MGNKHKKKKFKGWYKKLWDVIGTSKISYVMKERVHTESTATQKRTVPSPTNPARKSNFNL